MNKKYHFISGLPRSGSTLLSSILRQNPEFHASISDPVSGFVTAVINMSTMGPGMKSEVPIERRISTIKSMVNGYYEDVDKSVIFNTNRGWTHLTPQLKLLYPESKIILCVRDINWILDSFELAHRKNPLTSSTAMGPAGGNVYDRVMAFMDHRTGIVGGPYVGIKQAIISNEVDMIKIVEYNDLCKRPEKVMREIYEFIGESYYEHDFENVEGSWEDYDSEIGIRLHDVRKKVEFIPRNSILPPDILETYNNMEVWRAM